MLTPNKTTTLILPQKYLILMSQHSGFLQPKDQISPSSLLAKFRTKSWNLVGKKQFYTNPLLTKNSTIQGTCRSPLLDYFHPNRGTHSGLFHPSQVADKQVVHCNSGFPIPVFQFVLSDSGHWIPDKQFADFLAVSDCAHANLAVLESLMVGWANTPNHFP